MRRAAPDTRVGHAGTLDPAASGVVVVCCGAYTRLSFLFEATDKEYEGILLFGRTTDTLDLEGHTECRAAVPDDIVERVAVALPAFVGTYMQEVPRYSAAKWGGRPFHRWARAGADTPARIKPVDLRAAEVWPVSRSHRRVAFRVVTGSGFYVRAWARDLGRAVGIPALLARLHRIRVGPYEAASAVPLDRVCPSTVAAAVVADARAFPWLPVATVDGDALGRLSHGVPQPAPHAYREGLVAVVGPGGKLGLVAEARAGVLYPRVVLPDKDGSP